MNTSLYWMSAALLLSLGQQAGSNSNPGLQLLPQETNSTLQRVFVPDADAKPAVDRELWNRRLAVSDLDEREAHLDELVTRARTDDHLRLMLEEWAVDPAQTERAWTARMALRELGRRAAPHTLPMVSGQGLNTGFSRMLEMQMQLEDALLRLNDPNFGGWITEFGQDMDSIFAPVSPGQNGRIEDSKSFSLEVAPDGVHCELSECIDGQEVTKEYRADSYDELLEANPELREHLDSEGKVGFDIRSQVFDAPFFFGSNESMRDLELLAPDRTDRLGIETSAPSAARVASYGLDEGQGLLVLRVVPRSIAAAIGIRRGDLVVEMDEIKIFAGLDVRQVLSERAPDAELKVVVINSRGQRKELVWKPDY